jgi:phytoene dehydrogenase-like protein
MVSRGGRRREARGAEIGRRVAREGPGGQSPFPPPSTVAVLSGIVELGGHIVYKANVKEVLMEADADSGRERALGVRLSDGRRFRSKTVISNASRWDTFERMIGEERGGHGR